MDQKQLIIDKCNQLLAKITSQLEKTNNKSAIISKPINEQAQSAQNQIEQAVQPEVKSANINLQPTEKKTQTENKIFDGVAVVQSFWGIDISRITASIQAIQKLLISDVKPAEWIFIESQTSNQKAVFRWLAKYGIKYVFIKSTSKSDGIFLKMPLWQIGLAKSKAEKLVFLDSDVYFENPNWLESTASALDSYDVISPAGYCVYEGENAGNLVSVGKCVQNGNIAEQFGHMGLMFGCTRTAFNEKIKQFNPSIILTDLHLWQNILGHKMSNAKKQWISMPFKNENGLDVDVGSTQEICRHIPHGDRSERKYTQLTDIAKNHVESLDELFTYDKSRLPIWNTENPIGRIIRKSAIQVKKENDARTGQEIYFENAKEEFGEIDEKHPLIVCVSFIPDYLHRAKNVIEFKEKLERNLKNPFAFVCFTNEKSELFDQNRIDVIPLSDKFDKENPYGEIFRKDVMFPENSTVMFIDLDSNIDGKMEICRVKGDTAYLKDGIFIGNTRRPKKISAYVEKILFTKK